MPRASLGIQLPITKTYEVRKSSSQNENYYKSSPHILYKSSGVIRQLFVIKGGRNPSLGVFKGYSAKWHHMQRNDTYKPVRFGINDCNPGAKSGADV